jgi:hypothetical protein
LRRLRRLTCVCRDKVAALKLWLVLLLIQFWT